MFVSSEYLLHIGTHVMLDGCASWLTFFVQVKDEKVKALMELAKLKEEYLQLKG